MYDATHFLDILLYEFHRNTIIPKAESELLLRISPMVYDALQHDLIGKCVQVYDVIRRKNTDTYMGIELVVDRNLIGIKAEVLIRL